MYSHILKLFIILLCASSILDAQDRPLKVAVIGGMTMSGMWQEVSHMFTQKYGIEIEVVESGPKHMLDSYSRLKDVDLITMHSSDTIVDLVADGYFVDLKPWARNAQMLVSDLSNEANVSKDDTLEIALSKIENSKSTFLLHASGGTFEVFNTLRYKYHFKPNILFTEKKRGFLNDVVKSRAYTLYGVIPFVMKKQYDKNVVGHFISDKSLQRPYLSAIINAKNKSEKSYINAKLLQDFLLSNEVQKFLNEYRLDGYEDIPVFFAIK